MKQTKLDQTKIYQTQPSTKLNLTETILAQHLYDMTLEGLKNLRYSEGFKAFEMSESAAQLLYGPILFCLFSLSQSS